MVKGPAPDTGSDRPGPPSVEDLDRNVRERLGRLAGLATSSLALITLAEKLFGVFPIPWGHPLVPLVLIAALVVVTIWLLWYRPWVQRVRERFFTLAQRLMPLSPALSLAVLLVATGLLAQIAWVVAQSVEERKLTTTQYVGAFPGNMKVINEVIGRAKTRLLILTDYASYGGWSDPVANQTYKRLITERAVGNVDVQIIRYDPRKAREETGRQFKQYSIEQILASPSWQRFKDFHSIRDQVKSMDAFIEHLMKYNDHCATEFGNSRVAVNTINETVPIFLWIRDEEECVFSLSPDVQSREISFCTRDKSLIDQFINLYQIYKRRSTETPDQGHTEIGKAAGAFRGSDTRSQGTP